MNDSEKEAFEQRMKAEKQAKAERYHQMNQTARKGQVLFAGSSLMEQFPVVHFLREYSLPF